MRGTKAKALRRMVEETTGQGQRGDTEYVLSPRGTIYVKPHTGRSFYQYAKKMYKAKGGT